MNFRSILRKGISLKKQHAGQIEDGPLGPVLRAISEIRVENLTGDDPPVDITLQPVSLVGKDLAGIISRLDLWVLFVNTDGSGVAPWRGLIVLDADYVGEGQVESPSRVGIVAHELTHLLQREFKGSHYWPSGGFNPVRGRRWIGDSTTYMEMLAYIVGWTIEYDLRFAKQFDPHISPGQLARGESVLATIRDRLARFTGTEPRNASRMLGDLFPDNPIYRQNHQTESKFPDRRVPPGTWHYWLRQIGFSRAAVDHIMILAAQGKISRSISQN